MVWQDASSPFGTRLDPEQERELRLVAQACAGADWALAALVARYQPAVVRYLVRLTGDQEAALALAEHIFMRMERRVRGPHGGEYLRLWLLRASTEAGLEAIRHPRRAAPAHLNAPAGAAGLLADRVGSSAQRLRAGLGKLAERTGTTSRQVRQLIWASEPQPAPAMRQSVADAPPAASDSPRVDDPAPEPIDARDVLRYRIVRTVLADVPYGDAQCLALHLVAGLNQTEVARALGIRPSAARHHIVRGLQTFAQRYEAALQELGISLELGYGAALAPEPDSDLTEPALAAAITVEPEPPQAAAATELAAAEPAAALPHEPAPREPGEALATAGRTDTVIATSPASPRPREDAVTAAASGSRHATPSPDIPTRWHEPALDAGTSAPMASALSQPRKVATLVAEREPVERPAEGVAQPTAQVQILHAPPLGPIVDTVAVAISLGLPAGSDAASPGDERLLALELSDTQAHALAAADETVPCAAPAAGARPHGAARVVPVRSPAPRVVPVMTALAVGATPGAAVAPALVPVRSPRAAATAPVARTARPMPGGRPRSSRG